MNRTLQLRQEMAELLDFKTYAGLALSRRLARTVDAVSSSLCALELSPSLLRRLTSSLLSCAMSLCQSRKPSSKR